MTLKLWFLQSHTHGCMYLTGLLCVSAFSLIEHQSSANLVDFPQQGKTKFALAQRESSFHSCELWKLQNVHRHLPCGVIYRLGWHSLGGGGAGSVVCTCVWVFSVLLQLLSTHSAASDPSELFSGYNPSTSRRETENDLLLSFSKVWRLNEVPVAVVQEEVKVCLSFVVMKEWSFNLERLHYKTAVIFSNTLNGNVIVCWSHLM